MSIPVLIRPLLTEKVTGLTEKKNQFAFVVSPDANKIEIRKAIEGRFNVKVDSVRTMHYFGKNKSQQTKKGPTSGRKSDWKKAVVTLSKESKIDYYGTSGQTEAVPAKAEQAQPVVAKSKKASEKAGKNLKDQKVAKKINRINKSGNA
jgi:large subunit ribosomal protein L23